MIEVNKENMKKIHHRNWEKYKQKWEEVNKFLKENQYKKKQTNKQADKGNYSHQKMKIELIKKTQMEGILGMENLDKITETTDESITNTIQEMEEKIKVWRYDRRNRLISQRKY